MWLALLIACSQPSITRAYVIDHAKLPPLPTTATNHQVGGEIGFQEDLLYLRFVVPDESTALHWLADVPSAPEPIERLRDNPFRVSQPDLAPWLIVPATPGSSSCVRQRTDSQPEVNIRLDPMADGRHVLHLSCVTL